MPESRRGPTICRCGRMMPTALTTIALQSLSDYDLDLATISLRSTKYLGIAKGRSVAFAVEFLLDRQRRTVARFLAIEPASSARNNEPQINPIEQLLLPTTVSIFWTLKAYLSPTSISIETSPNPCCS